MVCIVCTLSVPQDFWNLGTFIKFVKSNPTFSCEQMPATDYSVDNLEGAMKALDQLFTFKAFS